MLPPSNPHQLYRQAQVQSEGTEDATVSKRWPKRVCSHSHIKQNRLEDKNE